ncbi:hypothetical protein ACJ73_10209, partial [Blastomyces percursus]
MPDSGCNTTSLIDSRFVRKHGLTRIPITPRKLHVYNDGPAEHVSNIVKFELDMAGHKSIVWAFEVDHMPGQDLILGLPWLRKNNVSIEPDGPHLLFKDTGLTVWTKHTAPGKRIVTNLTTLTDSDPPTPIQVNADAFRWPTTPKRRKNGIQVSAASMADIEKALKPKTYTDP